MDTYPKLRDLSFLQTEDFPIGENWQIPVMTDDDVLWSIVLAYLNSFPESNKNELDRHVVNLLGKKLRDAAFETDPKIENSEGKSALFYALTKHASNLLYFLYDHAVNACFQTSGIKRTVDSAIVVNLMTVKELLIEMKEKVEMSNLKINVKDNSLKKLDELCRFNDFQTEVCKSINFVTHTFSLSVASNVNEANERKKIILSILDYYEKYFEWNNEVGPHEGEIAFFQDFYKHFYYYENLDFCSAIMFFDNLFLLKERIKLSPNKYSEVESKFFLFIYWRKYFTFIVEKSPRLQIVSCMIIFQERLALKKCLGSFKKTIEKVHTSGKNTVDRLPKNEVRTLRNKPEIYGRFLVLRLKHYFHAVASINLIDFKAVLILQRTLQVIGECIKEGEEETGELNSENIVQDKDFKSVQKVFSLILPEGLLSILRQIRNELVHPKELINFSYRISAEGDYELFNVIRKEILTLEGIFNNIFCAQKYEMENYVSSRIQIATTKARATKISDLHKPKLMKILSSTDGEFTNKDNFEYKWIKLFEELSSSMTSSLNKEEKVINKGSISQLKYIFDNSFCALKNEVISMKNICFNVRASIDYMGDYFFSIEYIFSYLILKDMDLKHDLKNKLKNKLQERKDLFKNALAAYPHTYDNEVFQQEIEAILSDYEQIKEEIFLTSNCQPEKKVQFSFEHIEKFKKILKEKCYLNGTEKKKILKSIPEDIMETLETKCKLKRFLEGKGCLKLNKEEFGEEINKLPLKPREKQDMLDDFDLEDTKNSLHIINSVLGNFYPELQDAISKNELNDKKQYKDICNGLKLPDSSRDILSKIIKGTPREVNEKRIHFLRNRIKQLKAILIDEDASIKKLWESPQSTRKKSYVHELLVNVLNDPGTQAAVEMLLLDCMIILKTTDLKDLYRKTTNLFNGINLRNVLAHGNPLLESLGSLLDPRDLPSELVRKMIDLISDLDVIDCMVDILDEIGHVFETFHQFMNENEDDGFKELKEERKSKRKKIASSHNWEQYAKLIPRQQGSTTASPSPNEPTGGSAGDSSNDVPGPSEPDPQDQFSC
ncbi:hypothetical protein JTE90_027165 [Oedothorax gibbosus]|uniref:Uncharacterized protein n=1 Tax=Oedothorax gibbosus TaxID=931172 RepID=A0AAV6TZD6_9ARAC|nr:hypothetical protein JTE90_027165 [Oedothorax gibbosus]